VLVVAAGITLFEALKAHDELKKSGLYLNGEITNNEAALERAKAFITQGLSSGKLKPVIARTFPLEEIQEATRFLESNAQIGKVVVDV
jgi:NADPH:quinone reductase-like Zn-dependent oxidoreductase